MIKDSSELDAEDDKEGIIHGALVKNHFKMYPSELMKKYGAVFSGFAIMKGVFRTHSGQLNVNKNQ